MDDHPPAGDTPDRASPSGSLAAISGEMNRIYRDQFGRGASKVRTHWSGADTIVVLLEGTLTPTEQNLVKLGAHESLRGVRTLFQYATISEFCEPVERLTGRKVRSFLSAIDTEVDGLSIEAFVLHPHGYAGPSRAEIEERHRPADG